MQAVEALQRRADMVIRRVFGETSHYLYDLWKVEFRPSPPAFSRPHRFCPNKAEKDAAWHSGVDSTRNLFQVMLDERKYFPKPHEDSALQQNHLTELRKIITERFDDSELRTLCFDLDVCYDDLSGEEKASKARELVSCLKRRGRISDLVKVGKQQRPDISWDNICPHLNNE